MVLESGLLWSGRSGGWSGTPASGGQANDAKTLQNPFGYCPHKQLQNRINCLREHIRWMSGYRSCTILLSDDPTGASVRTPIAVVGIQPKLYSHSNWVGLNPFTFVSGVEVQCEQVDSGLTKVTVRVNRLRTFLWVAFWVACSLLAARRMPEPGGAILVIGVACAAWFGLASFLGGYLVKKEISDRLKDR